MDIQKFSDLQAKQAEYFLAAAGVQAAIAGTLPILRDRFAEWKEAAEAFIRDCPDDETTELLRAAIEKSKETLADLAKLTNTTLPDAGRPSENVPNTSDVWPTEINL